MATLDFGQGPKELKVTVWTAVLYEQEFGRDIVKDVKGREVLTADDIALAAGESGQEDMLVFDYTQYNWTAALRALWACLKTADPSVPTFNAWAQTAGEVNLWEIMTWLKGNLEAGLFRPGADGSE